MTTEDVKGLLTLQLVLGAATLALSIGAVSAPATSLRACCATALVCVVFFGGLIVGLNREGS